MACILLAASHIPSGSRVQKKHRFYCSPVSVFSAHTRERRTRRGEGRRRRLLAAARESIRLHLRPSLMIPVPREKRRVGTERDVDHPPLPPPPPPLHAEGSRFRTLPFMLKIGGGTYLIQASRSGLRILLQRLWSPPLLASTASWTGLLSDSSTGHLPGIWATPLPGDVAEK